MEHASWAKLAVMTVLSFVAMYILMYMMIDKYADFYLSVNQAYMAGSMTAAMVVIELVVMGSMYKDGPVRNVLIGVSVAVLAVLILFTRYQTAISETDFLRSMIPHHSGAILMCQNPNLKDPEIRSLCQSIIAGQRSEIEIMRAKLNASK